MKPSSKKTKTKTNKPVTFKMPYKKGLSRISIPFRVVEHTRKDVKKEGQLTW